MLYPRSLIIYAIIISMAALTTGCGLAGFPEWGNADAGADSPDVGSTPAPPELEFNQEISALEQSRFVRSCDVDTTDPDDDGKLEPGETTSGTPDIEPKKDWCAQGDDVTLKYRTCMVEKMPDGTTAVTLDALGREVCGDYETPLVCEGNEYVTGDSVCVDGPYCDVTMTPVNEPMVCGWRIVEFGAYDADGVLLEEFTEEALEEFEYDLLEVPVIN